MNLKEGVVIWCSLCAVQELKISRGAHKGAFAVTCHYRRVKVQKRLRFKYQTPKNCDRLFSARPEERCYFVGVKCEVGVLLAKAESTVC